MGRRANGEGSIIYIKSRKEYRGAIQDGNKPDGTPNIVYFRSGKGGKRSEVVRQMMEWKVARKKDVVEDDIPLEIRIIVWLEKIKKAELKPTSYDRLESIIKCQIIPRIGHLCVGAITDAVIQEELIDAMKSEGLALSSLKKAYNALNAYFKYAVYNNVVSRHPMGMMKPPKDNGHVDASNATEMAEERRVDTLSDDEIITLRKAALSRWKNGEMRYFMGIAYLFILNTGLRMGEVLALLDTDIDFMKRMAKITKNLVVVRNRDPKATKKWTVIVQNMPKTKKSYRSVPLNQEAIDILELLQTLPGYSPNGYLFFSTVSGYISPRTFEQTLKLMCKAFGMREISPHVLRHTYATKLFEAGVDIKIISELLGHSSTEVTYRIYIHVIEKLKKNAVTKAYDLMPKTAQA